MPVKAARVTAAMFERPLRRDQMLPEFRAVRKDPAAFARKPFVKRMLAAAAASAEQVTGLPEVTYTLWHEYERTGVRRTFDRAMLGKRSQLGVLAMLALFRRERRWIDRLHDYIWSVCEESNWVPPEHMSNYPIDLFSAETGFQLAEMAHLLSDVLDREVVERIGSEVERRILAPYLRKVYGWFDGHNNWTGVCEGSVGAAFLYLEKDPVRLARAVNRVLRGLEHFRSRAFLGDGGSSEGAGYWQYGLIHTVSFSELLRRRTGGAVDFLAHPKFEKIARYPLATFVAPGKFYSCSDCAGAARFSAGLLARLSERTGAAELGSLLNGDFASVSPSLKGVRDILWWDGKARRAPKPDDRLLPDTAMVRLVAPGHKLVLMAKAGHNQENHNHNDVGSFAVYVDGHGLLCDAGTGLYNRDYFGPKRYENPICSSLGHSVPVIDGREQAPGEAYRGRIAGFEPGGPVKSCTIEFARAYPVRGLKALERTLRLDAAGGRITLEDAFAFAGKALPVEEAFVTWDRVSVRGGTARVRAGERSLRLKIVEPSGAVFRVEELSVLLRSTAGPGILRRLACALPRGANRFVVEIAVV